MGDSTKNAGTDRGRAPDAEVATEDVPTAPQGANMKARLRRDSTQTITQARNVLLALKKHSSKPPPLEKK